MADISTVTRKPPIAAGDRDEQRGGRIHRKVALPGGRAVVGALLVTTAAVGVFAAYLDATATPDTAYVVVQGEVPIGTVLDTEVLTDTELFGLVPMALPASVADNALTADQIVQLQGRRTTAALAPGDLLSRTVLAEASNDGDVVSLSFPIDSARAVSGNLSQGERVDIAVTYGQASDAYTMYVARDVLLTGADTVAGTLDGDQVVLTVALPDDEHVLGAVHATNTGNVVVTRAAADSDAHAAVPAYRPPSVEASTSAGAGGLDVNLERYVLLAVATPRADWFREVGQWARSAAIPAEFVRCVSLAEVRARLASGRAFSALLIDGHLGGVDRDLVATAATRDCPVIVVDDRDRDGSHDLAPAAVLAPPFTRDQLLDTLTTHARMVGAAIVRDEPGTAPDGPTHLGEVVAVVGPGGTGASTAAIALAEGLARSEPAVGPVLLADLCRGADQAMLHDSRVVVPGIQELVEAHRTGRVTAEAIRDQTFTVSGRGYRLLLGLRRPRHYVTIRPRAFDAALDGLRRTFAVTVCDVDPDLEGEAETGSLDVEDRHLMSRAVVARSSVVFVVGGPGLKGVFRAVGLIGELLSFGAPAERIVPVVSRGPRSPRQRAEYSTALRRLLGASAGEHARDVINPIHLPERRVDDAIRDGAGMPRPLPATLATAYRAILDRVGPLDDVGAGRTTMVPGGPTASAAREPWTRD